MISRPGAVAARRYGGGVVLTNLPLARTAIDADGASRTRAGLLGELFAGESTAVVLVHRGLVGATAEGLVLLPARSEERRVGKGCRWGEGTYQVKTKVQPIAR